jgi:hypothetical protein
MNTTTSIVFKNCTRHLHFRLVHPPGRWRHSATTGLVPGECQGQLPYEDDRQILVAFQTSLVLGVDKYYTCSIQI